MDEIALLEKWLGLEQEEQVLEIRRSLSSTSPGDLEKINNELSSIKGRIAELKHHLVSIEDKSQSSRSKTGLLRQVELYIENINKPPKGLRLDRSQGTILENYLFSIILRDFYYLVTRQYFGNSVPAYLNYTTSNEDSVDISELTNFFQNEYQILRSLQDVNHVVLREYYNSFRERLESRFIN